jgi:electron transport complex protein RnfG
MREILRMIVVLAAITGVSGLLLAGVNEGTKDQRKKQLLQFVKGPAISEVLSGSENQPLDDVKELEVKAAEGQDTVSVVDIFPAYKSEELWAVAFEVTGKGYGGDIGVIVGIDVAAEKLLGIGITAHKETPGLGARIREEGFRSGFAGLGLSGAVQVKAEGGAVDAISGATISSRGVCEAVTEAFEFYGENKEEILASVADRG